MRERASPSQPPDPIDVDRDASILLHYGLTADALLGLRRRSP
jgi:hypothetical protein